MEQSISDKVKSINKLKREALELGLTVVSNEGVNLEGLTETAFGACRVENKWALITVKYNPETKEAAVTSIRTDQDGKSQVAERFKIEAALNVPCFNEDS